MNPAPDGWPRILLRAAALLAATAAIAIVAAVIALAGLGRLGPHLDPTAVPGWFWYFRADPHVRRWLGFGLLAGIGLSLLIAAGVAQALRRPLHGGARWAREGELRRAGLRAADGIVLGRSQGRPLVFGGAEHVALYAPTRSGKGVGVVIPNLLSWPGSVVVLDVKRENWTATAGFRAAHGQAVFLFDPLDPEGRTARYNPLGHINRADPVEVLDELQKIAVMLFPTPPTGEPFWAEAARTGFMGAGALIAESPDRPFSIGAIHRELSRADARTRLPAIAAERAAAGRPLSAGCLQALGDFCAAADNTFASVRQTLTARLSLWLNPRVCAATEASDFDLRTLRRRPQSIYLATSPDNLGRVAPLYALLAQQLVDFSARALPDPRTDLHQVLVLLDEFARLGHAEVLARAFSWVAGYGLRLLPVLQSPAQLRHEYGPDMAEEILANCGVEVVFAPKELRLARELSERLGYATVRVASRNRPSGLSSGRRSLSETEQRRALMLPQELMQLAASDLIVLRAGLPPVRGRKIVYWRERVFMRRLQSPPVVAARPLPAADATQDPLVSALPPAEAAELPPPPPGASVAEVEAWVERYIDAAARQDLPEPVHGR